MPVDTERRVVESIPLEVDWSGYDCTVRMRGRGRLVSAHRAPASRNRAVALGNHVFLPDRCDGDLGVLAHELTHCAQYQAWGPRSLLRPGLIAQLRHLIHRTLRVGSSPYPYRVEPGKPFRSYGMEQQAQMVEDRFRAGLRPGGTVGLIHRPGLRLVFLGVRHLVFPKRQHVAVGVGHHRHDAPGLLGRLGRKPDPAVVQHAAVVEQVGHEQGNSGVPADERPGLLMHRRMDAEVGLALEELRPERALLGEWQPSASR